ncbi:MAG: hypothetical protein EXR08_01470 [Alphaproteobacteria bacterium]|nr:hypothetical protein [Alphaproteobacteria bacterium]
MRLSIYAYLLIVSVMANVPALAGEDLQEQAKLFLATLAPPGSKISFAALESKDGAVILRDIVAHAETAGGEEIIEHIGLLNVQGLQPLPSGLFRAARLSAENIRIDAASDGQELKPGGIHIANVTASGIDGPRIAAIAASQIELSTFAAGSTYAIRIANASLKNIDSQSLTRAFVRANIYTQSTRGEDALLNALLNASTYDALSLRGLSLRRDKTDLMTIAEINSNPDGAYTPFPASGNFSIHTGDIDLLDPMAAMLYQWLGQDRLQFNVDSHHTFTSPAAHGWDISIKLSPDAELAGNCTAQNLNRFSPALIRQTQALSNSAATLRRCDMTFTGTEFVDRWLAQEGARQGLSPEGVRAQYLAGTFLASLDPDTANDPLAQQLSSAAQIFLTQPSRLNIHLAPQGGLKFPDSAVTLAMLFQGKPEQRREAMQKLGLSMEAVPLN